MALFKLPKKDKKSKSGGNTGPLHTTLIMQGLRKLSGKEGMQIPFIGKLAPEKQIVYTAISTAICVLLAAAALTYSNYQVGRKADFVGTSTEMQMLSQRIAKGAQLAVLGNKEAFDQLKDSKKRFDANLKRQEVKFKLAEGVKKEDAIKLEKVKVGGFEGKYQDISGTFLFKAAPFDPNAKVTEKEGYRQIYVIFEAKEGEVVSMILVGPAATIEKNKKGFDEFLKSFK